MNVILLFLTYIIYKKIFYKLYNKSLDYDNKILISKGIVNFENLLINNYSIENILKKLRYYNLKYIEEVELAFLDKNNELIIFTNNINYPVPVIIDGNINEEYLIQVGINKEQLLSELEKDNYNLKDIFYCFYKNNSLFVIDNNIIRQNI